VGLIDWVASNSEGEVWFPAGVRAGVVVGVGEKILETEVLITMERLIIRPHNETSPRMATKIEKVVLLRLSVRIGSSNGLLIRSLIADGIMKWRASASEIWAWISGVIRQYNLAGYVPGLLQWSTALSQPE